MFTIVVRLSREWARDRKDNAALRHLLGFDQRTNPEEILLSAAAASGLQPFFEPSFIFRFCSRGLGLRRNFEHDCETCSGALNPKLYPLSNGRQADFIPKLTCTLNGCPID